MNTELISLPKGAVPYSLAIRIDCSVGYRLPSVAANQRKKDKFPPTLNDRLHWAVRARANKDWKTRVLWAVGNKAPRQPLRRAQVIFTRHSAREPDFDNLVTSFKACCDGLVLAGVIKDDKPSCMTAQYRWEKAKIGSGFITISVDEI